MGFEPQCAIALEYRPTAAFPVVAEDQERSAVQLTHGAE